MGKRSSVTGVTKAKKVKKTSSDPLSVENITAETKNLLETVDELSVKELVQVIGHYDGLLEKFDSEEGLNKYEGVARLLNVQIFKVFEKLFQLKKLSPSVSGIENYKKYKQAYDLYKFNLLFFLENIDLDCSLVVDNLDIYMKLVRLESVHFAPTSKDGEQQKYFPTKTYKDLITALLKSRNGEIIHDGTNTNIVIAQFLKSYYKKYYDLQFYFMFELSTEGLEDLDHNLLFSKFLTVMKEKNTILDASVDDSKTFVSNLPLAVSNTHNYKGAFETNWLYFLNKELNSDQYKTILLILHKRIIPYFKRPASLMDFLTDSYEVGGVISILALNGLFELIKKFNLDYPNFYTKLYTLLDADLLHMKYRSRFLRLTDVFLDSTHLPAAIVASFIKKLARLSITASPSAVVSVIPFIYNLLKRHPTCMILLQNTTPGEDYKDVYDDKETDPLKTNAIESSLWEMETLASHYHPNVATLAKIFSQPFRKQSYNMEDFLDWSYDTLLESESTRRLKSEVALEFETFEFALGDYVKEWKW